MKRKILAGLAATLVVAGASAYVPTGHAGERDTRPSPDSPGAIAGGGSGADEDERVALGFEIAPVPLNLEGRNPRQVGLGSYLVNSQGSCNDCHTEPPFAEGGNPFFGEPMQVNTANYLAGGGVFGPFVSRNITPSVPDGLPAGRTLEEFIQILQTGINLECQPGDPPPFCPLLQVMPWSAHQDLVVSDIRAIYEYLSAIPHAEPASEEDSR